MRILVHTCSQAGFCKLVSLDFPISSGCRLTWSPPTYTDTDDTDTGTDETDTSTDDTGPGTVSSGADDTGTGTLVTDAGTDDAGSGIDGIGNGTDHKDTDCTLCTGTGTGSCTGWCLTKSVCQHYVMC